MFKNRKLEIKLVKDETPITETPNTHDFDTEVLAKALLKNLAIATVVTVAAVVVINVLGEIAIKALDPK